MVALVFSLVATVLCAAIVVLYGKRRPVGAYLTWGEAMVASVFVFGALFLLYGILPHQWLVYADNELAWRRDKILMGPGDVFDKVLPFTVTYEAIRDFIAVGIYIVGLGGQIALWSIWQNRGKTKPKALPTSAFGRPLARPSAPEPARSRGCVMATDANPPMPYFAGDYVLQEIDPAQLEKSVKPKQFLHIDQAECIMCEGCVDICPWKCIHMLSTDSVAEATNTVEPGLDPDDHVIFVVDEDVCTRCALCVDRCPTGVIVLGKTGVSARDGDQHQRDNNHGYAYGLRF